MTISSSHFIFSVIVYSVLGYLITSIYNITSDTRQTLSEINNRQKTVVVAQHKEIMDHFDNVCVKK